MSKSAHPDVRLKGVIEIKTAANVLHLVPAATASTVSATAAASLLSAAMTSADYTITGTTDAKLAVAVKTVTAGGSSGADVAREWRFCDTATSRVLWTTDETSGAAITSGSQYTTPALEYNSAAVVGV